MKNVSSKNRGFKIISGAPQNLYYILFLWLPLHTPFQTWTEACDVVIHV